MARAKPVKKRRFPRVAVLGAASALILVTIFAAIYFLNGGAGGQNRAFHLKPDRVLVVVGTQIRDNYVIHNAQDSGDIIALLKLWGVPFDLLRLDTHSLSKNDFVDSSGHARYSTIIWTLARKNQVPWQAQNLEILTEALRTSQTSLIAVGRKIQAPSIQTLLGLKYTSWGTISAPVAISSTPHFITRGLEGTNIPASEAFVGGGPMVELASADVKTLASSGSWPQLTVRTLDAESHSYCTWIGGDQNSVFRSSATFIALFRRALVFSQGYGLYKDYIKSVVLRMDDPGAAQNAYLSSWSYPVLSQSIIEDSIIKPLEAYHAKLGVGVVIGYPWLPTHQIIHSVTVNFTDPFGKLQNVISMAAGMREGVAAGVLEIQSHGFTHLVPDLDTPIKGSTNWWNGTIKTEWGNENWYREFYDTRRSADVPAEIQRSRLVQASDWIEQDYGSRPLIFIPPGHAISGDSFTNDGGAGDGTGRITVTLAGVAPLEDYALYYGGPDMNWTTIGTLRSDKNGVALDSFELPPAIFGLSGGYFSLSKKGSGTQFCAGLTSAIAGSFNYTLRDFREMTPDEHAQFYLATESLGGGTISGYANGSYKPQHISPDYTYKIAAQTGYGLALDRSAHYLGPDYVISLPPCVAFDLSGDFSRRVPAVYYFHDSDIANDPFTGGHQARKFLSNVLKTMDPAASYLSMDEWSAYLHAALDVSSPDADTLQLSFTYDKSYGRYFAQHSSEWTLHLSDDTLREVQAWGAPALSEKQNLTVPAGVGTHTIVFHRPTVGTH